MREREIYLNPRENNLNSLTEEEIKGNNSLEEFILEGLSFNNIEEASYTAYSPATNKNQIPSYAAIDIVVVDSLNTSLDKKLKLLGYRFWNKGLDKTTGDYSLVKRLLPEGLVRIDDNITDVLYSDELVKLYDRLEEVEETTSSIIFVGPLYISRFKQGAKIVNKLLTYGINVNEVDFKADRINTHIAKLNNEEEQIKLNEQTREVELLHDFGCVRKEIMSLLNITDGQLKIYINSLFYFNRINPKSGWVEENKKLMDVIPQIQHMRNKYKDPPISIKEITDVLGVSKNTVNTAIAVLLNLGLIERLDNSENKKESKRRYHNTSEYENIIEKALIRYKTKYPLRQISIPKLKELSGLELPLQTIRAHYHAISGKSNVPPLKNGSTIRAVQILLEFKEKNPQNIPTVDELVRMTGMSRKTFTNARKHLGW